MSLVRFGVLATALSFPRAAQTQVPATLTVAVQDSISGNALSGVQIADLFTGRSTTTDAAGAARLGFVTFRGNNALVEFRKIGYAPKRLAVARSDTGRLTVSMVRLVELPASVRTESYKIQADPGTRAGFERRCAVAYVTCLRAPDMARRRASSLGDILGDAKGMTVAKCGVSRGPSYSPSRPQGCSLMMLGPFGLCEPTILVNGFGWDQHVLGPPIDPPSVPPGYAPFGPGDVAGIEIYPGGRLVPARFLTASSCGVVVIWTK